MNPTQLQDLINELALRVEHYGQQVAEINARRMELTDIISKLRDIQNKQTTQPTPKS